MKRHVAVRVLLIGGLGLSLGVSAQAETRLRVVLSGAPTGIDPVQTTAAYGRDHGFLIYDQLFALDSAGVPQPQMVDQTTRSADGRDWRFTLRPGLLFHDGAPVRAADAVASIRRWGQRDAVGRALLDAVDQLDAPDDRIIHLHLARPFAFVQEALARPSASALFVMPKRVADTPPDRPITDATGSGPFIFVAGAFQPGHRAVYVRNPAYQPRTEPPDGLAGGKVARVDRIEWLAMPDPATAAAALQAGEIDYFEQVPPDLVPVLERAADVRLFAVNPHGFDLWLRPNHLLPPFDDPRARQALRMLVNSDENLDAAGIRQTERLPRDPNWFTWPEPPGAGGLSEARTLLQQAGYDGRAIVMLDSVDQPIGHAATLAMAQRFAAAGLRMDVVALDWGTVTQRRNSRRPVPEGGWNLFVTLANVRFTGDPLTNLYLASPCEGGTAGWPCDPALEALRRAWWEEADLDRRAVLHGRVRARAAETLPFIDAGRFRTLAALRSRVQGVRATVVPVFWGVRID